MAKKRSKRKSGVKGKGRKVATAAARKIRKKKGGGRRKIKSAGVVKKPVLLAAVDSKSHITGRGSGLVLYWLTLLVLVILNMFSAVAVAVLQLALSDNKLLFIVATIGFFFGYVTNRLVNHVDNLELKHHFFARLLVPAAAILNLLAVSAAANALALSLQIQPVHSPVTIAAAYGIAFAVPSVFALSRAAVAYSTYAKGGRNGAKH
ncbi:hypothetical protein HYV83_02685 [Candidatus Woesearchaeota archaeon]|nr:hypothetical protein [Candidatus Woesearchaeota archaeon]